MTGTCCAPSREGGDEQQQPRRDTVESGLPPATALTIDPCRYPMGDESPWAYPGDGEGPVHEVSLPGFMLDRYSVTNAMFEEFVTSTGWRTDAEKYEWSFVFSGLLPDDFPDTRAVQGALWWRQVYGADWNHPEGPKTNLDGRDDHPVVHVSWNDAMAYCEWAGGRLPSEAEWECAARGGLVGQPFPWGADLVPEGEHRMNVFQGEFPQNDTGEDGFKGTCPVDAFEPNGLGFYNMTGNVWEWCSDRLQLDYYAQSPVESPLGPDTGAYRVQRGGSFLCHESYCRRYRVSARFGSDPTSSASNVGFRWASDSPAHQSRVDESA